MTDPTIARTTTAPPVLPEKSVSVFADFEDKVWPFVYDVTLTVKDLHGGRPQDPRVVEGWIRSKIQNNDERLRRLVQEAITALDFTEEDLADPEKIELAITEAGKKALNGFYRLKNGELAVEGRQIKAMLKEATNIAFPWKAVKPRKYNGKSMKGAVSEHVFVKEDFISLGVTEPDGVDVRFSSTSTGRRAITREEFLDEAIVNFTMVTDMDLKKKDWAQIFVTGQMQGFGTSRSQGYGTFKVTRFDLRK
jgi:hypothetical protein